MLNKQLTYNQYIAGSDFSIVDITAIVAVDFLKTIKIQIPAHMEFLLNWKDKVSLRSTMRD